MSSDSHFEKWNFLPEEVKLECIKWLDFKTRYNLRNTSHTEQRLVNMAKRCTVPSIDFIENSKRLTISMFLVVDSKHPNPNGIYFKLDQIDSKAVPFLSYLFQTSSVIDLDIYCSGDIMEDVLSKLEIAPNKKFNVKSMSGSVPLSFLQKCEADCIREQIADVMNIEQLSVEEFFEIPSVRSVKRWDVDLGNCPDLGLKVSQIWMERDVDVKSLATFDNMERRGIEDFVTGFEGIRVIQKTTHLVRFKTHNSQKHMLLRKFDRFDDMVPAGWCLAVIPADTLESDYQNYVRG